MTYGRAICMFASAVLQFVEEGIGNLSPDYSIWLNAQRAIDTKLSVMRRNTGFGILYQQNMTLFVLAHEIGHAISGHLDKKPANSREELWEREFAADEIATTLHANWVMSRLEKTQNPRSPNTEEFRRWRREHVQSQAMGGVALALGVWEIAESVARELGQDWKQSHPPSSDRYSRYKKLAVKAFDVGSDFFEEGEYFGPNPERSLTFLNGLFQKNQSAGSIAEVRDVDSMWSEIFKIKTSAFLAGLGEFERKAHGLEALSKMPLVEAQVARDIGVIAVSHDQYFVAVAALRRAAHCARGARNCSFSERIDARDIEASALEGLAYIEFNRGKQANAMSATIQALKLLASLAADQHLWAADRIITIGDLVHRVATKGRTKRETDELLRIHWAAITTSLKMAEDLTENTLLTLEDIKNRMKQYFELTGTQYEGSESESLDN